MSCIICSRRSSLRTHFDSSFYYPSCNFSEFQYDNLQPGLERAEMYNKKYTDTIKRGEKVVDLGSGNDPFPKATVCVDYYEKNNYERDGADFKRPTKAKYVRWNLNKYPYPFKDKEFDFVIAAHIAEHLDDPLRFCQEIQRIGKRGYIETPNRMYELIYGWDFHKWYVNVERGILVFENIVERTFMGNYIRTLYHTKAEPEFRKIHDDNLEKLLTAFYWEDSFAFEIRHNPTPKPVKKSLRKHLSVFKQKVKEKIKRKLR